MARDPRHASHVRGDASDHGQGWNAGTPLQGTPAEAERPREDWHHRERPRPLRLSHDRRRRAPGLCDHREQLQGGDRRRSSPPSLPSTVVGNGSVASSRAARSGFLGSSAPSASCRCAIETASLGEVGAASSLPSKPHRQRAENPGCIDGDVGASRDDDLEGRTIGPVKSTASRPGSGDNRGGRGPSGVAASCPVAMWGDDTELTDAIGPCRELDGLVACEPRRRSARISRRRSRLSPWSFSIAAGSSCGSTDSAAPSRHGVAQLAEARAARGRRRRTRAARRP